MYAQSVKLEVLIWAICFYIAIWLKRFALIKKYLKQRETLFMSIGNTIMNSRITRKNVFTFESIIIEFGINALIF